MELTYKQAYGTSWSFVAMEYYLGILNRTYQVFVTPTVIAGAFVNGLIAAPMSLPSFWFVPSIYTRKRLLEKYEQISLESEDFKSQSPLFNFQYQRAEIQGSWFDPTIKWGMGTVAHSGKLNMKFANGRKREFILLGLQQGKELVQHLQKGYSPNTNSDEFSETHKILGQIYADHQNLEAWITLAELFRAQGEKAQEHYCRIFVRILKLRKGN